jgi:hypothetical protein
MKYYSSHRTQRGGHKGGKFNAQLAEEGHQIEPSAVALCRLYKRRLMWFLDPDILHKLEEVKAHGNIRKRDVLTARPEDEYVPQNFVRNEMLLLSIYPSRNDDVFTYSYNNCMCNTCHSSALTLPMDTSR